MKIPCLKSDFYRLKFFKYLSNSTGCICSTFGFLDGLLFEVTGSKVTACGGTDCQETASRRIIDWAVCWTLNF